jgi:hypothetical protein
MHKFLQHWFLLNGRVTGVWVCAGCEEGVDRICVRALDGGNEGAVEGLLVVFSPDPDGRAAITATMPASVIRRWVRRECMRTVSALRAGFLLN